MLIDYIVGIGLDAVKDRVIALEEQQAVRDKLKAFLERQSKLNESCTLEEELDFGGLTKYIRDELIGDVRIRLFGETDERHAARTAIISKAVAYSQSKTKLSKRRAINLTADAIDILRCFYREKINRDLLFIATEIEDTIIENVTGQLSEQTQQLASVITKSGVQTIQAVRDCVDSLSLMSIDRNLQLMKNGSIGDVESNATDWIRSLSGGHILFPDYGYDIKSIGGKLQLQSIPLSNAAIKKYPPKMNFVGTVRLGDRYVKQLSTGIIDYSNRHQIPIIIDIQEARKLLGDIPDPVQHEAEKLIGKELTIPPKPFPEAFPCSVSLDGNVEFEYFLFRAQEILDDGTIVISNCEQSEFPFRISMKANLSEQKMDFSICTDNPNNKDLLRYVRFMKKASAGATLTIKVLSIGQTLAGGKLNRFEYQCGFSTINEEILFLEKIVSIEDYFGISINIPSEILSDDYDTLCYISTLISGGKFSGNWNSVEFSFELTEDFKNKIEEMDDSKYSISYVGSIDIPLYGEQYHMPVARTYEQVQINDIAKSKQKAAVLDVGDTIKVVYIPGESNGICHFDYSG